MRYYGTVSSCYEEILAHSVIAPMDTSKLRWLLLLSIVLWFPCIVATAQEPPHEELIRAEVLDIRDGERQSIHLHILTGTDAGTKITVEQNPQQHWHIEEGETVVIRKLMKTDTSIEYMIAETYRLPALLWIGLLFVGLAILLGGRKGIGSITGLFLSIGILIFFIVPKIAKGSDPVFISVTGALAIACTSLFLAHGFRKRTFVAFLSTLATLTIATGLATFFVHVAKLFGAGSEEALFLQSGALENVNLRGLLLGGMIIGCLGVLDDVTVAQTAVVDELRKANPSMSARNLIRASLSIGKEHIASMINTLALAYAGASLPLLLLFTTPSDYPLWFTLNGEFLAEEIIRTLVGSTSLLFAVPISTAFAVLLLKNKTGILLSCPFPTPPREEHA